MISIVCVYNNQRTLKNVLLKSLANQTAEFELLTLDNTGYRFKSAAEAMNHGGARAKGDYIMFAHQDVWLGSSSWLEEAEEILESIPDLGIAGVAGISEKGRNIMEGIKFSFEQFDEACWIGVGPIQKPEEVQTLDECLLIIPRPVFGELQFDEKVFDGWIPASCFHSCLRAIYRPWEFKELLKFQKRLYLKHRRNYKPIYTWMGEVSWLNLRKREIKQLLAPVYFRVFPDFKDMLKRELSECETVLDLGCGHHSLLHFCKIPFLVGVELFEPYLKESKRKGIHSQYLRADISRMEFKPKSFDAVIAIGLLEHLPKQEGYELLNKATKWARKKVVITTPNGYLWQEAYDDNPLQEHKSGWDVNELRELGFRVRGAFGWKRISGYKLSTKYEPPAFLWRRVSDLTEKITCYFPEFAFLLLATKRIDEADK